MYFSYPAHFFLSIKVALAKGFPQGVQQIVVKVLGLLGGGVTEIYNHCKAI